MTAILCVPAVAWSRFFAPRFDVQHVLRILGKLWAVPHRVLPVFFGCLVLLVAAPASAQPPERAPTRAEREAARQAYEEGSALYERGEYVRAIEAFERAHGITGAPELLYNIYTAAQRAGELQRASDALSAYLASDAVPAEERPALEQRLTRLAEEIEAERRAEREEEEARRAAEERLREAEARAAENAPRVSSGATVALVVGAVGLAGFATFAGLALREDRRVSGRCGVDVGSYCTASDVRQLRAYSLSADVSLGLGAAGVATGLIVYFAQRARRSRAIDERRARLRLDPLWAGPAGMWGLSAQGAF